MADDLDLGEFGRDCLAALNLIIEQANEQAYLQQDQSRHQQHDQQHGQSQHQQQDQQRHQQWDQQRDQQLDLQWDQQSDQQHRQLGNQEQAQSLTIRLVKDSKSAFLDGSDESERPPLYHMLSAPAPAYNRVSVQRSRIGTGETANRNTQRTESSSKIASVGSTHCPFRTPHPETLKLIALRRSGGNAQPRTRGRGGKSRIPESS